MHLQNDMACTETVRFTLAGVAHNVYGAQSSYERGALRLHSLVLGSLFWCCESITSESTVLCNQLRNMYSNLIIIEAQLYSSTI